MSTSKSPPPIQYLPAFITAARLKSFKQAAQQLHVTPSAISQQIKSLETQLGLSLFDRQSKELQLTQTGKHYFEFAADALDRYQNGWQAFSDRFLSQTLRISLTDYMANQIVIPRLKDFVETTGIQLELHTSSYNQNLLSNTLDAAIRFGTPPWPHHNAWLIADAQIALVATPDYFHKHPIKQPSDWKQHTLIHARRTVNDWQRLEHQLGYALQARQELVFDSYESAIQAARAGLGVMMASFPISNHEI